MQPYGYQTWAEAPESHRAVAIYCAQDELDDATVAELCGLHPRTVRQIRLHPPILEQIQRIQESAAMRVLGLLNRFDDLESKAVDVLEELMGADTNQKVRLAAATEVLDRAPGRNFLKQKQIKQRSDEFAGDSIAALKRRADHLGYQPPRVEDGVFVHHEGVGVEHVEEAGQEDGGRGGGSDGAGRPVLSSGAPTNSIN